MTDERRDRAYLTEDEVDKLGETTDTELYEGDEPDEPIEDNLELLTERELREGETADAEVATEEGLAWVPPIDPPVVADEEDREGARLAAGFGVDAFTEPYDRSHHGDLLSVEDELEDRIREALRADSSTSRYADSVVIGNRGGTVVVRGVVDDIDDTDNIAAVISNVAGVDDVVDETDVAGVTS
jgi:hypothetical protein